MKGKPKILTITLELPENATVEEALAKLDTMKVTGRYAANFVRATLDDTLLLSVSEKPPQDVCKLPEHLGASHKLRENRRVLLELFGEDGPP